MGPLADALIGGGVRRGPQGVDKVNFQRSSCLCTCAWQSAEWGADWGNSCDGPGDGRKTSHDLDTGGLGRGDGRPGMPCWHCREGGSSGRAMRGKLQVGQR